MRTILFFLVVFLNSIFAQYESESLDGPSGGWIVELAVHPNGNIYAQDYFQGIYESTDNGNSWSLKSSFPARNCGNLVIDSTGTFYLSVSDFPPGIGMGTDLCSGFLVSENCKSWKFKKSSIGNEIIYDVEVLSDSLLAASTKRGVYYVENYGGEWNLAGFEGESITNIKVVNGTELFVAINYVGIYHQPRYGTNWQLIETPTCGIENFLVLSNEILIFSSWGNNSNGVMKTSDRGRNWVAYNSHYLEDDGNRLFQYEEEDVYVGTKTGKVLKLTDNKWELITETSIKAPILFITKLNSGEHLVSQRETGILRSCGGSNDWKYSNSGLPKLKNNCLYVYKDGTVLGSFGEAGIYKYVPDTGEWNPFSFGLNMGRINSFFEVSSGDILAGTYFRYLYRLKPGEICWKRATEENKYYYTNEMMDLGNNKIGAVVGGNLTEGGLYISNDEGQNWRKTEHDFYWPNCGAIDSNGVIFIGDRNLHRSFNGGEIFEEISQTYWDVEALEIGTISELYVGISSGEIRMSYDSGNTFESRGRIGASVVDFAVCEDGRVFAATFGEGVFLTNDYGYTWSKLDLEIDDDVISLNIEENIIYIGTATGVYKVWINGINKIEDTAISQKYILDNNYPNPFNPTTTISYSLPSSVMLSTAADRQHFDSRTPDQARSDNAKVSLKVYDILGNEVATLVNEQQSPGNYEYKWNASNYTSGVYIYQLQVNEGSKNRFTESAKMILLK